MSGYHVDLPFNLAPFGHDVWVCTEWTATINGKAPDAMAIYDGSGLFVARDGGTWDEDGAVNGVIRVLGADHGPYSVEMDIDRPPLTPQQTSNWTFIVRACPPTAAPTAMPTPAPSADPTARHTSTPSPDPTADPTVRPTPVPSERPTLRPSNPPSDPPTPSPICPPLCHKGSIDGVMGGDSEWNKECFVYCSAIQRSDGCTEWSGSIDNGRPSAMALYDVNGDVVAMDGGAHD